VCFKYDKGRERNALSLRMTMAHSREKFIRSSIGDENKEDGKAAMRLGPR